jgi:hypothetical protein
MTGFINMQRDALDHHLLKDADRFRAWFWLLASAAWKPTRVRIKGETVTLKRGELTYSVRFLAEAWGWSKSRVDRFLSALRDEGMIETRAKNGSTAGQAAGQGQSIITICNYTKYQSPQECERDNDVPENGTTAGQQRDKEEEVNKSLPNGRDNNTRGRAREGTRLPDDWEPKPLTEPLESTVAAWPVGAIERELAKFRDWAASANGPNALKKNWDAAWRNWLRRREEDGRCEGRSSGGKRQGDGVAAALDEWIEPRNAARSANGRTIEGGRRDSQYPATRIATVR